VQAFFATPKQNTDAMFDYLYANKPRSLQLQQDMARRYANAGH
jgi:hypothetical protein